MVRYLAAGHGVKDTSGQTIPVGTDITDMVSGWNPRQVRHFLDLGRLAIVPEGAAVPAQVEAIIKSGAAAVADNVLPPGLRIPEPLTVSEAHVRVGTAPTGANLTVEFNRNGVLFATVTVLAGATSGSVTGLSEAFAAGDILTWDITAVGSTTAGADVAAAVVGVVA